MSEYLSLSTALEPENSTTTGAGAPSLSEPKPDESHSDSLRAVMKEVDDKAEVKEPSKTETPKAEPAEKAVAPKEEKAQPVTETDKVAGREAPDPTRDASQTEQQHNRPEPPARFSEAAKAVWRNVPREAQNEIARWSQESEEAKPRLERYEAIREFDEIAKSNGRDLRDTLGKMYQFERMMPTNPIGALHSILQEIGPTKADGSKLTLMEVAQHIMNTGQEGMQRSLQAAQQDQARQQQEQQVREREAAMQMQNRQLIEAAVVNPFRASHPRYDELSDHIAMFLQSDMVPKSLSLDDRLARAYELAERINPASNSGQGEQRPALDAERRADADFSGSKSIKSSPGLVTDEDADDRAKPGENILESIQKAARQLKRA